GRGRRRGPCWRARVPIRTRAGIPHVIPQRGPSWVVVGSEAEPGAVVDDRQRQSEPLPPEGSGRTAELRRPASGRSKRSLADTAQRYKRLERALLAAMAALVAIHVGVLLYHLGVQLAFPYDLNYGEGYVLNDAVRLAHGEPLYVDLQQFPMVRSPYPPLYPLVWSALVPFTGPVFWPGRALSVL